MTEVTRLKWGQPGTHQAWRSRNLCWECEVPFSQAIVVLDSGLLNPQQLLLLMR